LQPRVVDKLAAIANPDQLGDRWAALLTIQRRAISSG
jgi:hypothetical protein